MEEFATSIGAFAETVALFYDTMIAQGLNADEAMELAKHLITVTLKK